METTSALRCTGCGKPSDYLTYLPTNDDPEPRPYCGDCAGGAMPRATTLPPIAVGGCPFNAFGSYMHEPSGEPVGLMTLSTEGLPAEFPVRVCRHCHCLYYEG